MEGLKYQFSLKGEHESTLREASQRDRSQDIDFIASRNVHDVINYRFGSLHLEGLTDKTQVWDRASQLLKLYNAAYELVATTQASPRLHHKLALEALYVGDSETPEYPTTEFPLYQIEPFEILSPADKAKPLYPDNSKNGTLYGQLLYLARTDSEAREVLEILSHFQYMPDYYKVFESASTAFGGDKAFEAMLNTKGLLTDYNRFMATTNNFDIGKQNARHGRQSNKAPKPGKKIPAVMSNEEAKQLAMNVVRAFFTEKYDFVFPTIQKPAAEGDNWLIDENF